MAVYVLIILFLVPFAFLPSLAALPGTRRSRFGICYGHLGLCVSRTTEWLDQNLAGGFLSQWITTMKLHQKEQKHPVALYLLLTLLTGGAILFLSATWPYLSCQHRLASSATLITAYFFIYLCNIKPGPESSPISHVVTQASHQFHCQRYPYDYKLFHPDRWCSTCQRTRPARSKHCTTCNACIARVDHHCVWIDNCIGMGNHKYFLGLLLSMTALLLYAPFLAYLTVATEVRQKPNQHEHTTFSSPMADPALDRIWRAPVSKWPSRLLDQIPYQSIAAMIETGGLSRTGIGTLALVMSIFPLRLGLYQLHLIRHGMTTYERGKWDDWHNEATNGCVYYTYFSVPDDDNPNPNTDRPDRSLPQGSNNSHTCPPSSSSTTRQLCVVAEDGLPPRQLPLEVVRLVGEKPEWRRCHNPREIRNDYDKGFWLNLKDILTE